MVPAMTYATPESFWYSGGVWDGSWLDWTWLNIAPDLRRRRHLPGPRTEDAASAAWERDGPRARRHRPLLTLADFQDVAPWYYDWMRHPPGDPWWSWAALDGRYGRVGAAVLNLSGWFDEPYGPVGAVVNYEGLVKARPAAPQARLILGAWTHGVGAVGRDKAGDRGFGKDAALDYAAAVLQWMDRYVKGVPNGVEREPAVRVFVMGANRWRTADRWPLPDTRADTLYLQAPTGPTKPGRLLPRPAAAPPEESAIASDPAAPLADPFEGRAGSHDYRKLLGRPELAAFETAPFSAPREIIGQVIAELAVSASVPDFDIWLQLYDVAPDGTAWNLSSPGTALLRASYRKRGPERHLVEKDEVVQLKLDRLLTANRFLPGHRLRIVVSTAFFPFFSINPQTGAQEFETANTRAGEIRIHHSPTRVSRLILPTVPLARD
jgi:putative CocE/NonD family hydrolase